MPMLVCMLQLSRHKSYAYVLSIEPTSMSWQVVVLENASSAFSHAWF